MQVMMMIKGDPEPGAVPGEELRAGRGARLRIPLIINITRMSRLRPGLPTVPAGWRSSAAGQAVEACRLALRVSRSRRSLRARRSR